MNKQVGNVSKHSNNIPSTIIIKLIPLYIPFL